jgi:RecA-family ATPase
MGDAGPDKQDTSAPDWYQRAQQRAAQGFAFDETPKEKAAREAKIAEDLRAAEEAGLQKEKLRRGVPLDDGDPVGPPRQLINRPMSDVRPRAIDWMWKGWIPKKYITLIVGETGAGKSTVLADIVARLTIGAPWPGDSLPRPPGRVLWLGSEDGAEDMTVPRLIACGADLTRITEIQGVMQAGKRTTFSMQDDLEAVRAGLAYARSVNAPFDMLVVDPITSYLPGRKLRKVDVNDTGQFRSIIEPWFEIAQTHNLAICSVTHFNKDATRSMLHRVTGTAAFTQTCRSLCAFVDRKTDEEPYGKAMVQVKTNLPEHPGGAWRFQTKKITIGEDPENGRPIVATHPKWDSLDPDLTPESLMGGERGPVSSYGAEFGQWVRNHFMTTSQGAALPVTGVKNAALAANVSSDDWWAKNSGQFLHKYNVNGIWMCVLRIP